MKNWKQRTFGSGVFFGNPQPSRIAAKVPLLMVAIITLGFGFVGCDNSNTNTHTHEFGLVWKNNELQHWHECSCGEKADIANHIYDWIETDVGLETLTCTVCGAIDGTRTDTVYVLGSVSGSSIPRYWKDGIMHTLTTEPAQLSAIAVSNSSVYIAGVMDFKLVYWKNGILNTVSDRDTNAGWGITGMAVIESDVYIAGTRGGGTAFYFKNDVQQTLEKGVDSTYATGIAISGNDIYVVGSYRSYMNEKWTSYPCYWKNGELKTLEGASSSFFSLSLNIAISGSDIYILGRIPGDTDTFLWKNGEPQTINGLMMNSTIRGFAVLDSDIFFGGVTVIDGDEKAYYWKNGESHIIDNLLFPEISAFAVSGYSNIYFAGSYWDNDGDWDNEDDWTQYHGYWKNGVFYPLETLEGENIYYLNSIAIESK
jgi:hypothetical protein